MTSTTLTHHWWLIADNDQEAYEQVRAIGREHHGQLADMRDALKAWTIDHVGDTAPSAIDPNAAPMAAELMLTALDCIDWYGIACTLDVEMDDEEGR